MDLRGGKKREEEEEEKARGVEGVGECDENAH